VELSKQESLPAEGMACASGVELGKQEALPAEVVACVNEYHDFVEANPPYSDEARDKLAAICLRLCKAAGSVGAAARALRVGHPGKAGPHLSPSSVERVLKGKYIFYPLEAPSDLRA
jgi:hypothetical protein